MDRVKNCDFSKFMELLYTISQWSILVKNIYIPVIFYSSKKVTNVFLSYQIHHGRI